MKVKWIAALVILFGLRNTAAAQTDFPLSTLTSSPVQLNPSSVGLFNDVFRVHTYFKSQMAKDLAGGIKGTGAAFDYNIPNYRMGLGMAIYSNSLDKSALRDFNMLVSYGYRIEFNRWSLLSLGVQGGFKQVGFSIESLTFGSQYDPTYRGGYDPARMPVMSTIQNKNSFDASVGAQWYGNLGTYFAMNAGMAAFHLIPVKTDFLSDESYLKPKYIFNLSARYEGYYVHWIPSAIYVSQSNTSYAEIGVTGQYRQLDKFVNAGVYVRTPNVIIPTVGLGWDKFTLNLSIEYYLKNTFSQIFNISISYFPQTNRQASLIQDFDYF